LATEVNKLSYKEKVKIIQFVAEHSKQRISTAVTIQGNSIEEYIKLIHVAKSNNANWIILQPLLKENTTDKDCYIFFNKLILYVGNTLVGIQNAKEYLGAGVIYKDVIKLYKKFPNFRVMKAESSAIFMGEEIKQYPRDLRVFNGRVDKKL
jgi:dihydrodipicolinate synthase/N-acetylneuraminate lyase